MLTEKKTIFTLEMSPSCSDDTVISFNVTNIVRNGTLVEWKNAQNKMFIMGGPGFTYVGKQLNRRNAILTSTFTLEQPVPLKAQNKQCRYQIKQFTLIKGIEGDLIRPQRAYSIKSLPWIQPYRTRWQIFYHSNPTTDYRNFSWYDATDVCTRNNWEIFSFYTEEELLSTMDSNDHVTISSEYNISNYPNPLVIFTNQRQQRVSKIK